MDPNKRSPLENLHRAVELQRQKDRERKLGPVGTALVAEAFRRRGEDAGRSPKARIGSHHYRPVEARDAGRWQ